MHSKLGHKLTNVKTARILPRTQASLFKKQWCAYDEFTWSIVVGRDGRRGWWEECTWNARRLAVLGRFLATKYDFLQVVIFRCRLRFFATCFCCIDKC
jgi:hypothetical protein